MSLQQNGSHVCCCLMWEGSRGGERGEQLYINGCRTLLLVKAYDGVMEVMDDDGSESCVVQGQVSV